MPHAAIGLPGDHFEVSPDNLPKPGATLPDDVDADFTNRPPGAMPQVPIGFAISIFGSNLGDARWMAVAPNGDVFLAQRGQGRILLLRDANGDGNAEIVTVFAQGFSRPHGLAFHDGALYVADVRAVWRLAYREGDRTAAAGPTRVTTAQDLRPTGHNTRDIAFDSKGALFLAMGSRGDLLEEPAPGATVQQIGSDGAMATFASGLRNPVGIAFYPGTDDLWVTVNERDRLGARLPSDYLARIAKGDFFGWPYAYTGPHPDPIFGARRPDLVAMTKTPDLLFEAHSAPLGLVFYDGAQFPAEFKGDAFVALHGPGPYDKPDGYKVVRVKFANGRPRGGYEDFVTGFWIGSPQHPRAWGTPAGLAVAKDGSLLIADETNNCVWRVAYTGR